MLDVPRDIHDAFRSARRQSGVTVVIVLTLAVGIGAATAIFALLASSYSSQLDVPDADRMYHVVTGQDYHVSRPRAQLYRESLADLGEIALWDWVLGVVLTVPEAGDGTGKTVYTSATAVSPEFFDVLGAQFSLGRDFLPEEHRSDVRSRWKVPVASTN